MKIVYNTLIPFRGFTAITIFEWVFARSEGGHLSTRLINHESIHIVQCREMLYVGFYLWYICEYLIRLVQARGKTRLAYRMISLEREAYGNEANPDYRKSRKHYAWRKYLTKPSSPNMS